MQIIMKNAIILTLMLMASVGMAQDAYAKGMAKAFELWEEDKIVEASNLFERIALAEQDNWLPYYYVAQVNSFASFGVKDATVLENQLGKAKEFLDIAKRLSPDNPELLVQEALINTAWIAFDGAAYGMTLSSKNTQLYRKALELAPENPRVVLSKAEWDMGSASYFGKDLKPYCTDVERALKLFANFKSDIPFYPRWGKERAEEILANCGGQG